jgi:uncharacterized NAD-dependent epimerase/dehydratase family protein
MKLPSLSEMIRICEAAIAPLRSSRVIGIALNTHDLTEEEARRAIEEATRETGLPATDPVRFSPDPLVDAVLEAQWKKKSEG